MYYLGYVVSCEGITSQPSKIEAIMKIAHPENVKEVCRFLGMIKYYRDNVCMFDAFKKLVKIIQNNQGYPA